MLYEDIVNVLRYASIHLHETSVPLISSSSAFLWIYILIFQINECLLNTFHDDSVVYTTGTGQLQANPAVTDARLSLGKPTRRALNMMWSIDLGVGKDDLFGTSCQRYNWQACKRGLIVIVSTPRRGKTLISIPVVWRTYPLVEMTSVDHLDEESGVERLKAVWRLTLSFHRQLP